VLRFILRGDPAQPAQDGLFGQPCRGGTEDTVAALFEASGGGFCFSL
jgi:hypothetical protein